ncbi:MAG: asparagine synthetase B [Chlamydiia bacterium]|nr:asparagine synthetase B [Chlamydiia bacterium]
MVGLAGMIHTDVMQLDDSVDKMLECLKHRGDGHTVTQHHKTAKVGITGRDAAYNTTHSRCIYLDGHIDNVKEIADKLSKSGKKVWSHEPASLALQLYEALDIEFLKVIEGDFALILLDQKKDELILARDRIGKKPLYWFADNKMCLFASELKGLLATGLIPQTPSEEGLGSYLFFGYIPRDLSPVKGVNKLLPGHYLRYKLGRGFAITPYWSLSGLKSDKRGSDPQKKISNLLEKPLTAYLSSYSEVGCIVSGGLGSAMTAYLTKKVFPNKKTTAFTVAFAGETETDIHMADLATTALKMPHEHQLITKENFFDQLPKLIWHLDEPLADPNITATWRLLEMTAKEHRLAVSGMGSDELLAGHSRYTREERSQHTLSHFSLIPHHFVDRHIIPFLNRVWPPAAWHLSRLTHLNPWQFEYIRHTAIFDENVVKQLSPKLGKAFDPECFQNKFHKLPSIPSLVSAYLYFDLKTRLPDLYILQYERFANAHNLRWMTPFLDRNMIEYAATLPEPESLEETFTYLRPIVEGVFPEAFLNHPKKTRSHFLDRWLHDEAIFAVFSKLKEGFLVDTGLISSEWLELELDNPTSFTHLFSLLVLEIWYRLFIHFPPSSTPPEEPLIEFLAKK